ncbi:argininosuccinate lyase [candidate division KSB1 bacterium]|nr:argininosuccinate lyase [candidate division KSB1 bacterium]
MPGAKKSSKLWDKGFETSQQVIDYTVGNDHILDRKLVKYDCLASIAHARMLASIDLLTNDEVNQLDTELRVIMAMDERGEFIIAREQEDCHTAIENHLTERLGDVGKKIHTARSRNDQVLTAMRLYCKAELGNIDELARLLIDTLESFKAKYKKVPLPGYTHTRKAMPSSVALWSGAFIDSMQDNLSGLASVRDLIDQSPLGTGAGYGIPLPLNRKMTAKELGFARVQENPIYSQISRGKFEAAILHQLSQIMFDLNRMATDLIMFSMPEFGFFKLPKEFCTGSSIMPQKHNPDVFELMRGKYHQLVSYEFQLKNAMANLISGYHRDVQLTKEPVMNGFDITITSLEMCDLVMQKLDVDTKRCQEAMTSELYATQRAYELVQQGMPFRDAYRQIAKEFSGPQ